MRDPMVMLFAGGTGLVAFLLQRAGFGIVVRGLLPPPGLLAAVLVLGKAAGGRRGGSVDDRRGGGKSGV